MNKIIIEDATTIAETIDINWQYLKNKTVLIAGANGYVPQFFVHGLLRRNELYNDNITVIAMCRNEDKAKERFGEYYGRNDFHLLLQDVISKIDYDVQIDFIIHAASPAGIKLTMDNPLNVFKANITGCDKLLSLAMSKKARVLYISSVDIYGNMSEAKRMQEDDIGTLNHLSLRNVYASSKRMAETLCVSYGQAGVDSVIVRPSQVIGPGVSLDDERLHINMVSQVLSGNKIILKGDGTPKRTFIYVTDAVAGMLAVLTKGKSGEAYNICTEECEATVRELAEVIAGLVKGRRIEVTYNMETRVSDPAVKEVVSMVCTSSQKLQRLGWTAHVSLADACKRMMDYYGVEVN